MLVLCVDEVTQSHLDFSCGQFLAFCRLVAVAEEVAQRERSPAGLCIFRIGDTRYGAQRQSRLLGNVFQNHGAQRCLVAIFKEAVLPLDDGTHGDGQCMATHPDGLDEALCGIHLFLGIE